MNYIYCQILDKLNIILEALSKPNNIIINTIIPILAVLSGVIITFILQRIGGIKILPHHYKLQFYHTDMQPKVVPLNYPQGYHFFRIELPFTIYNTSAIPQFVINPEAYLVFNKEKIEKIKMDIEGRKNEEYNLFPIKPFSIEYVKISFEYKSALFLNNTKIYHRLYLQFFDKNHKKKLYHFPKIIDYTYNGIKYDLLTHLAKDLSKK